MTLKEKIKKEFPNAEFDNHCSDLYVYCEHPEFEKWLKANYEFPQSITKFRNELSQDEIWFEIPFAYYPEMEAQKCMN